MISLKHTLLLLLTTPFQITTATPSPLPASPPPIPSYPRRTIAGVSVIDTPLVRAAQLYAQQNTGGPSTTFIYAHIMRSWLFGTLILQHNSTLRALVDPEVHAVAAILHDLGWDQTPHSPIISPDRRFEVDGAIAARNFIRGHVHGRAWDERRVQLVWDAIALHTERAFAYYKELEVQVVSKGIALDFMGEDGPLTREVGVTRGEYEGVVRGFPKEGFKEGVNGTIVWLCGGKAGSTYDTWMQPWGDRYVANYSAEGNRRIDTIFQYL